MTSGTSGVYVAKPCIPCHWARINAITQNITEPTKLGFNLQLSQGNSKNIDLSWTTSSDVNVNHFVIEKSATGEDFYDVGVKVAFGNDANKTTYSFSDNLKNPNELIYYYRIRMVYNDGKEQYSDIQSIRLSKELTEYVSLIAYPNPVSDELLLTIPANWQNKKVKYEIYRIDGQQVFQKLNNYTSQTELFNTSNLSPGIYIVRAFCNGETVQQKIIKR